MWVWVSIGSSFPRVSFRSIPPLLACSRWLSVRSANAVPLLHAAPDLSLDYSQGLMLCRWHSLLNYGALLQLPAKRHTLLSHTLTHRSCPTASRVVHFAFLICLEIFFYFFFTLPLVLTGRVNIYANSVSLLFRQWQKVAIIFFPWRFK